ncbi:hypothetical protein THARTR1_07021 [Trichoderma harzianum]|uniref:NAD(P)-binding protein n=1 Tax=Trichoderma harzianum TaxID=5544 RepID=A0A2K0U3S6_TRIHA|nr:hypothetical protein THARTR1_07021 [Trichoderma harzianum]
METVLVVGASGNIGVSVIIAALRSGRRVLAIVRNNAAEQKIIQHVGTKDGITFVEAQVTDEKSVQKVVDRVKAGQLPDFQHVYSAGWFNIFDILQYIFLICQCGTVVGKMETTHPTQNLQMSAFRDIMSINLEGNFLAYRATIPYLIDQGYPNATWTLVTGSLGDLGFAGVTAISQGALFSLASVACLENLKTNVRFNEVYLGYRVDYDSVVEEEGGDNRMKSSEFAHVYETILANRDIRGCRITVSGPEDVDQLKYKKKLPDYDYDSLFAEYM